MTPNPTVPKLFNLKTSKSPHKKAIGHIEENRLLFLNNNEYKEKVRLLFHGLQALGINLQDKVGILANTSKEWHFVDLASMCARAVVVPVYPTYLSHEVEFILNHSEVSILFIDSEAQLQKIINEQKNIQYVKYIISLKDFADDILSSLDEKFVFKTFHQFLDLGSKHLKNSPKLFDAFIDESEPHDIASIIYTSGTTGEPKGAVISQKAFSKMLLNAKSSLKNHIQAEDRNLIFLPLSHVLGRCDSFLNFIFEFESVYAESLDKVVDNLKLASPTILIAVPRIFEKVYSKTLEKISNENEAIKRLFNWAETVSKIYFDKINQDKAPSPYEILQKNLAYNLVFKKIYDQFGGRVRFLVSGGAPLSPEIINFLQYANLTILEGYGLTETIAPCVLNPPVRQIPGTIGIPLGDVQVAFLEDGEIILKTEALFSSYYKNEAATQAAFIENGKGKWFLTGDIGEMTPQGYIKITDRKKDIIITSGGKNVAPQKIENLLKLQKHISNAMIVGDKRKFLIALISIDLEAIRATFKNNTEIIHKDYDATSKEALIYDLIDEEVNAVNRELASFESIKGFYLVPSDFSVENGQITPSLKLKKKVLLKTYEHEIDALYAKLEGTSLQK